VSRDKFLNNYMLGLFPHIQRTGSQIGGEAAFTEDFLESMNPDSPGVTAEEIIDNPKEFKNLRNKAFKDTYGQDFVDQLRRHKYLGSGAFGAVFEDPDDPTKVFKAQRLETPSEVARAEREVETQLKAAEMNRAPRIHAVETSILKPEGMDVLRALHKGSEDFQPTLHVTEMDRVDTVDSQGGFDKILNQHMKSKGIDTTPLSMRYENPEDYERRSNDPEELKVFQTKRDLNRKKALGLAQLKLDLADKGIDHHDLDHGGFDREEHMMYDPKSSRMKALDYGVAQLYDHKHNLHEHSKNLNIKNSEDKNYTAEQHLEHFLDHKFLAVTDGLDALGNKEESDIFSDIYNEMGEDYIAKEDLINQGREIVGEALPVDAELQMRKGKKTGYTYGKMSNPSVNQILTDINPTDNDPDLKYDERFPEPAKYKNLDYLNKKDKSDKKYEGVEDLLKKLRR